jgi:signal-transduction protein with cAMP-binding, CBS, and nucleotidyltransferase domain
MSQDKIEKNSKEKILIPNKAEDVMVTEVLTLDGDVSVKEAAEIMAQEGVSAVIVTIEKKANGILTERDILKRIVAEGKNSMETKVKEIMSSPLIIIEPNMDLEEAARLMFEKKIKNLPVVHENRLVGLVGLQDILKFHPEVLKILKQTMEPPKNIQKVLRHYII